MLNLLDQLLGLTVKVLDVLFAWPFLLFVFLVWLVSRYRDQIGATLDRRGAIKRSELSSAIREELDPINKDLGNLKPDVSQLRTQMAKLEASQSEYASERLLDPITAKVKALEETSRDMKSELDRLSGIDVDEWVSKGLEPVGEDLTNLGRRLDELTKKFEPINAEMESIRKNMEQLADKFGPVNEQVENLGQRVIDMESRQDSSSSTDSVKQLQVDTEQMGKELSGLSEAVALLKSEVETAPASKEAPASPTKGASKAATEAELIPLRVMKDALASTRWEWRRVKKLASIAGLSEEKAMQMLESDPELIVKKDDWGRRIAKLSKK
jgi:predicted  nucleic acid-binding Zn-ribbon protein